jgi:hypothetical protein
MLVGDEGEAELLREPGDRLVIVADDEGDVGEGLGIYAVAVISTYLTNLAVCVASRAG